MLSRIRVCRPHWIVVIGTIGSLLTLPGCGPRNPTTVAVQGKVTYRGKPLEKAEVQFSPIGEKSGMLRRVAVGEVDSQGVYSLNTFTKGDGVLPGEYAVTISRIKRKNGVDAVDNYVQEPPLVPPVYNSPDHTPLKATVPADARGTLTFDFDVKD